MLWIPNIARLCASSLLLAIAFTKTPALTDRENAALRYLMNAERVESAHVGVAGVESKPYLAMRIIGRSRNAGFAFRQLVEHGTTAGQLYGLTGVYRTDPAYFRMHVDRYKRRNDEVPTLDGCIGGMRPVREVVKDIAGYAKMMLDPAPTAQSEQNARRAEETCDFTR